MCCVGKCQWDDEQKSRPSWSWSIVFRRNFGNDWLHFHVRIDVHFDFSVKYRKFFCLRCAKFFKDWITVNWASGRMRINQSFASLLSKITSSNGWRTDTNGKGSFLFLPFFIHFPPSRLDDHHGYRFCNPTGPKHAGGNHIRFCVGGEALRKLLLQQYCTRKPRSPKATLSLSSKKMRGRATATTISQWIITMKKLGPSSIRRTCNRCPLLLCLSQRRTKGTKE